MADAFPISGQIDPKAFPFLVVQLHRRGATGSLKVEGPSYHKALYFRAGRVLFGSSNDPRDQLGAILIEGGKITPEQLEDVNAKVGPGNPLAKVLSDTGFVSQRELSEAARAKVERILSDVLAYTTGSFDFEDGVLPKGAVDLKLSTERLVMSAVRRVGDRNFVLRHIDGLDAVLGPTAEMVPRLAEIEAETSGLPKQLDGRRTLKEAAATARLEEFEAAKIACGLLFLGLVERVQSPVSASATPAASFADAEGGSELDLGATAAQALSSPMAAEPTVEPEVAASATATRQEEAPPFVVEAVPPAAKAGPLTSAFEGLRSEPAVASPPPAAEAPPEFRFEVPPLPAPEPEAAPFAFSAEPALPEPASTFIEPERPAVAVPAPAVLASVTAAPPEPPPDVPGPAVPSTSSPLPLVMPEPRTSRPRSSPPPSAPAGGSGGPRSETTLSTRASRPSKEDMAALDALLNSKSAEGPLTPLDKSAAMGDRAGPTFARSMGGRRAQSSRTPIIFGAAAVLLAVAAGGWYYVNRMGGRIPFVSAGTPTPPMTSAAAPTTTLPSAPVTTAAAVAATVPQPVAPTTVAAAPATLAPAPPSTQAAAVPPTTLPSPRTAAAGTSDPRALLRSGRYPEAAHGFASSTRAAGKSAAVIQLLVACSAETVQKAVDNASGPELLILPVNFKGRECYRLCWGLYTSEARATSALHTVPEYFRNGGAAPKVLGAAEVVP